jgi:glycerol-1-phosphate dehydrogenase [NAD(P)+]
MTSFSQLLNKPFTCSCGRKHTISIEHIALNDHLPPLDQLCIDYLKGEKLSIVSDATIWSVMGEAVTAKFAKGGFKINHFLFDNTKVKPDEKSLGQLLMNLPVDTNGLVAVGSGTITDLVRYAATITNRPFISVPSAPSMDGYASSVSSLIYNGRKTTYKGKNAIAIAGDVSIIAEAPQDLVQAGFGDIIGKKIAISDWLLPYMLNDEYYCNYAASLVKSSTDLCIRNVSAITHSQLDGIRSLMEALVLSGLAISLVGNSRPASGTEHLLAHYFESAFIKAGKTPVYHGVAVALGTLCATHFYQYVLDTSSFVSLNLSEEKKHVLRDQVPSVREVENWLEEIGLSKNPLDYKIEKPLLEEALLKARYTRDRYTILSFAAEHGLLGKAVSHVVRKMYV